MSVIVGKPAANINSTSMSSFLSLPLLHVVVQCSDSDYDRGQTQPYFYFLDQNTAKQHVICPPSHFADVQHGGFSIGRLAYTSMHQF